nr:paraneoplastic antigen Ma1 homolog [Pelodiscus sinensis]|eukprot:XP_025037025.1 paraneoplastic antigen Ma1 homolog [Pelodiscus sinensis]
MACLSGLLGPGPEASSSEAATSADDWAKALGQILEKCVLSHAMASSYCKLRLFPGEEEFEPWLEHTTEMLNQWAVPDREKQRCLVDSLRGPALDVIRTLKLTNPEVSVKDCLEALTHTFGSMEGPEGSFCNFLNAKQHRGEEVSAYVQRLERLLQRAVIRGAVTAEQMDQTRLAQIVRGTPYYSPILLHLRLRERLEHPPAYSQLIKEVREEEERQATSGLWEAQRPKPTSAAPRQTAGVLMVNTRGDIAQQVQVLTERIAELQRSAAVSMGAYFVTFLDRGTMTPYSSQNQCDIKLCGA